ncbi:HlyD family secretion protein [Rhizobium sp. PL01]|uniref:HlyD family secretion protein n=1 Tax=Rhizobium sp. PL01 TaxID=3085631 RepID=UPI002980D6F6|nr:HlyD family efflux transporter periplasmic adaptor subunit [Rhizobium sp. PL01]MDW5317510.1 HlyD family efflux transporter periplasmic adaptor subunit [Rhizobium sp. PL01]
MIAAIKRPWVIAAAVCILAGAALYAWYVLKPSGLPDNIASGNGRIEAVEIDVSTRSAGRIQDIVVQEGEFVHVGQIVANMDTLQVKAQLREAEAQSRRAVIGVDTARSQVVQREAEKDAAIAVVAQRDAELDAANRRLARSTQLATNGTVSAQILDDDRATMHAATATVAAAKAQLAATQAAIGAANSQVIDAQATVEATSATVERIEADIDDSALKSPRDGRVQYRVAQPGEVLAAGGRVLNLVDLGDVYMTFFLSTNEAGRVAMGSDVRLVLDAANQFVIPAKVSFVADVAQFTPKTVETTEERQKLMFRIRARIDPDLLKKYITQVKTGLPGMAYVRLDPKMPWPVSLDANLAK